MGRTDERALRRRLERVEALHAGATTSGEREAAARARERLLERIALVRANDPVARFCAEHVAALGVAPAPPHPPTAIPTTDEVLLVLDRWAWGAWDRKAVHAWAAAVVDRVTLPDDPDEEGAVVAEVLLQLASLHLVRLSQRDLPRIRDFLLGGDWTRWFALVEEASCRRARRAG